MKRIRKIRKIKKIKTFVPRKKEDIPVSKIEKQFGFLLSKFGIELEQQYQIAYKLNSNI